MQVHQGILLPCRLQAWTSMNPALGYTRVGRSSDLSCQTSAFTGQRQERGLDPDPPGGNTYKWKQ